MGNISESVSMLVVYTLSMHVLNIRYVAPLRNHGTSNATADLLTPVKVRKGVGKMAKLLFHGSAIDILLTECRWISRRFEVGWPNNVFHGSVHLKYRATPYRRMKS